MRGRGRRGQTTKRRHRPSQMGVRRGIRSKTGSVLISLFYNNYADQRPSESGEESRFLNAAIHGMVKRYPFPEGEPA